MWIAVGALYPGASRAQVVDFVQVNLVSDIRGDGLPQFQLALVGALTAAFVAPFSAQVSDASALVTAAFSTPCSDTLALPMSALVAGSTVAAADNLT